MDKQTVSTANIDKSAGGLAPAPPAAGIVARGRRREHVPPEQHEVSGDAEVLKDVFLGISHLAPRSDERARVLSAQRNVQVLVLVTRHEHVMHDAFGVVGSMPVAVLVQEAQQRQRCASQAPVFSERIVLVGEREWGKIHAHLGPPMCVREEVEGDTSHGRVIVRHFVWALRSIRRRSV